MIGLAGSTGTMIGRLRYVWLAVLIVLVCVCAAGLLFVAVRGWPDIPSLTAADAQSIRDDPTGTESGSAPEVGVDKAVPVPDLINSVARQAAAWDIRTCLPQIARISDFLTTGQSYTALSQRGRRETDDASFSATIAARDQSGQDSISTFMSVPMAGRACQSAYQTVAAFDEPCEDVQSVRFSSFTEGIAFGDRVAARHNGQGSHVYFLPLGKAGCVIVKTQVLN